MSCDFQTSREREKRGVYRVLVGKLEGKRPLGRPRRRWVVDNIDLDLQEVGCGGRRLGLSGSEGQLAGTCECGNELSGSMKYGEFLE
jgi:hypothetical protein